MEAPGLLDLPPDAVSHVLLSCSACDLASLACSCTAMRALVGNVSRRAGAALLPPLPLHPLSATVSRVCPLTASPLPTLLQDGLWQRQCDGWLAGQRSSCGIGNGLASLTAPQLRQALQLGSYRLLHQALHRMGAWPCGVWYATNGSALPQGRLLVGQLHAPSGAFLLQQPRQVLLHGPTPAADAWQLQPNLTIRAEPDASGTQVSDQCWHWAGLSASVTA